MAQYMIDNVQSPIDFQETDALKRTLQNAKNLLMCRMGEVPYDRLIGFNPALFDLPWEDMLDELLPELDRVMAAQEGISVEDAEASRLEDGSVYIRVIIEREED